MSIDSDSQMAEMEAELEKLRVPSHKDRDVADGNEVDPGNSEKPVAETLAASPTQVSPDPCLGFKFYQLLGVPLFALYMHVCMYGDLTQTLVLNQHIGRGCLWNSRF